MDTTEKKQETILSAYDRLIEQYEQGDISTEQFEALKNDYTSQYDTLLQTKPS